MPFSEKEGYKGSDYLKGFSWHLPGIGGMFVMLAWLLVGTLIGALVGGLIGLIYSGENAVMVTQLVSYPIMFIPPMLAAKHISGQNCLFSDGVKPDSNNFAPVGGVVMAVLCVLGTIGLAYCMDALNAVMPPIPEDLEKLFKSMVGGNVWLNFLCVSVMAPIFEEWLCRGTVLRGLLNYERVSSDGSRVRGLAPWLAIVIQAAFFALIHMNIWQALPAFCLGVLFGYVYYRTGSLKLTMLMHCANNTMSLILGQLDSTAEADTFLDIMPTPLYWCIFVVAAALVFLLIRAAGKIPLQRPQGNCDIIPANDSLKENE